jgi:hypothetical protein
MEQYLDSNWQSLSIHAHRTVCDRNFQCVHYQGVCHVEKFVEILEVKVSTVDKRRVQKNAIRPEKFLQIQKM